jgi:hypothetical protein
VSDTDGEIGKKWPCQPNTLTSFALFEYKKTNYQLQSPLNMFMDIRMTGCPLTLSPDWLNSTARRKKFLIFMNTPPLPAAQPLLPTKAGNAL